MSHSQPRGVPKQERNCATLTSLDSPFSPLRPCFKEEREVECKVYFQGAL